MVEVPIENLRQSNLLRAGALQNAIFNSAHFLCIATDAKGVIQIFNVGAERMLGYAAADVINKIILADITDPQEAFTRAKALNSTPRSHRASKHWCARPRVGLKTSMSWPVSARTAADFRWSSR